MGRLGIVVAWVSFAAIACEKPNPAVCCTSTEDCAAHGLSEMRSCAEGELCIRNECELPQSCQSASDCEAPTPLCASDGVCAECLDSSTCGDQVCDEAMHQCRDCTTDDECATGFCSPATNRCAPGTITPRYLPTVCDTSATTPLMVSVGATFDTTVDSACDAIVGQTSQPELCIMRRTRIEVAQAASLRVTGTRGLVLVATDNIDIAGVVDVSADGIERGPGGGQISGGRPAANTDGGGGAGFQTVGGHGGNQVDGGASNAGAMRDPIASAELLAGATSGAYAEGGGGGGLLVIISCTGEIVVSGVIDAGGGGGPGGFKSGSMHFGGGGGGSGGHIVLQGRHVTVTGQMFANGGAGGSGKPDTTDAAVGTPGADGTRSADCAAGGGPRGGGGSGGCSEPPGDGKRWVLVAGTSQPSGGGGGGSAGFLRVFTPTGVTPTLTPTSVSPGFEPTGTVETH